MNALKLIVLGTIIAAAPSWAGGQQPSSPHGTNPDYTVTVRYGTNIPFSNVIAQELKSDVLEMVRSANYNSAMPHKGVWQQPEPSSEITRHYRKLLADGKYVLVKWAQPQKLQTVLGELTIVETIVELDRSGVWMCCTDAEGHLARLGKFRGDALTSMEKLVRQLAK